MSESMTTKQFKESEFSQKLEDDGFKLQHQKLFLTYKSHINKKELRRFLKRLVKHLTDFNNEKFECYIAHENADSKAPYEHTHVVVNFSCKFQCKSSRRMDWLVTKEEGGTIHPHISVIKKPANWWKALNYICKEDEEVKTEVAAAKAACPTSIADKVWENASLADALTNCRDLKDVIPTIALYNSRPMEMPESDLSLEILYPWQKKIWDIVNKPLFKQNRIINWVYEEVGNTGKTSFAQWASREHVDKCTVFNSIGRVADFAQNVKNYVDAGWRGNTMFFNLARKYSDKEAIYEVLEMVSDGHITSTKYAGRNLFLNRMHIVVFANFHPKTECLSADRWRIWRISPDGRDLGPVTLSRSQRVYEKVAPLLDEEEENDDYIEYDEQAEIDEYLASLEDEESEHLNSVIEAENP